MNLQISRTANLTYLLASHDHWMESCGELCWRFTLAKLRYALYEFIVWILHSDDLYQYFVHMAKETGMFLGQLHMPSVWQQCLAVCKVSAMVASHSNSSLGFQGGFIQAGQMVLQYLFIYCATTTVLDYLLDTSDQISFSIWEQWH